MPRDYLVIYGIAVLIAYPLAYLAMEHWLAGFAYRIEQPRILYLFSFAAFLAITLLTIGSEVLKASKANPVDSLRYE